MGNYQSDGRRVTVVNDEAGGVIKISDSVVSRLKGEMTGQQQASAKQPDPSTSSEQRSEERPPPAAEASPNVPAEQPQQHHHQGGAKTQRPIIQYVEEPSLTSLKVRAEKENELAETDRYWKARLSDLEKEQSVLSGLQAASVAQSVKEMGEEIGPKFSRPVCAGQKREVTTCFQQNKGAALNCSGVVRQFSGCVDSARLGFVDR